MSNIDSGKTTKLTELNTKIINVADYGSDGAAIQAAIDALPTEGGMVLIPEGTYNITTSISITKNNVTIVGAGTGTILNVTAQDTIGISITADDIIIRNIKLSGPGNVGSLGEGIYI